MGGLCLLLRSATAFDSMMLLGLDVPAGPGTATQRKGMRRM